MTKKLRVYDNEGITFDRYTVITPDGGVFGMSENANSPNGFNQYCCQESDLRPGKDGIGIEIQPTPQCVKDGLRARGYSARLVTRWSIESARAFFEPFMDKGESKL